MSSHADTILEAGELWRTQAANLAEWSMRASDMKALASALLAENQRYKKALERISTMPNKRDSIVNAPSVAIEALAGDGE